MNKRIQKMLYSIPEYPMNDMDGGYFDCTPTAEDVALYEQWLEDSFNDPQTWDPNTW